MKTFEGENYYQILQVPPDASIDEIKRAYRDALAIYEEESIATYSLFSEEQRKTLLQAIETAYNSLVDEDKRAAYNQMLIDSGQAEADDFSRQGQRKLVSQVDPENLSKEKNLGQWVRKNADSPEIKNLIEAIISKEMVSGEDLKQLREALGIEISEVYNITKISPMTLRMIESNQFGELPAEIYLKNFLKAYAEILQIDPQHVAEGYLTFMARQRT